MYTIYFEDGQVWQGDSIENSKWNEMPNKLIKRIIYKINKNEITLEGYEAYNHIVERVQFILNANQPKITKVLLMALSNRKVNIITFNIEKNIIESSIVDYGMEYYNKPTTGWKSGLILTNPHHNII